MNSFIEVQFSAMPEESREILTALLADAGFDYFDEELEILKAYAEKSKYNEQEIVEILETYPVFERTTFQKKEIEKTNWNAVWESNFKPIRINDLWSVRAPFHEKQHTKNELIINPQMSFGTGHHQTTHMMIEGMAEMDFKNKTVFDFGSGTGILAIMAAKLGASYTAGLDHEEWAYKNAIENEILNNVEGIDWFHGELEDAPELIEKQFDVLLANINRNILLRYMERLSKMLHTGGVLMLSGILQSDIEDVSVAAKEQELILEKQKQKDNWTALSFIKK